MGIKFGDAYLIPVRLRLDGAVIDLSSVETVEFMLGLLRKRWPEDADYDGDENCFLVPLTQEESLRLAGADTVKLDVRVKFTGGCVIGLSEPLRLPLHESLSKKVL